MSDNVASLGEGGPVNRQAWTTNHGQGWVGP